MTMGPLKQDRMTSDERMIALMRGEPVDRVPFGYRIFTGFSAFNVGYSIRDVFTDMQKCFNAMTWTAQQYGWQMTPMLPAPAFWPLAFGGEIKWPSDEYMQSPMTLRHPVSTEKDVERLEIPDVKTAGVIQQLIQLGKLVEESGARFINFDSGLPFDCAAQICGVEQFCRWMMRKPELAHRLLRLALDYTLDFVNYWMDTFGLEHCQLAFTGSPTSSNQIISPRLFEKFAFPYLKEFHEKILAMGIRHILCHICGDQNLNLPLWSQLPYGDPGIISIGHEVDIDTAIKYFPDHILCGNVEPSLIQTGTPRQVYEQTKTCIEKGRRAPRGFMLAPGCELPPRAPHHNVWMMMKAIDDFGWYE